MLGAGLMWFGWFGFDGGAAVTGGSIAAVAMVNTQFAACCGALSWTFFQYFFRE